MGSRFQKLLDCVPEYRSIEGVVFQPELNQQVVSCTNDACGNYVKLWIKPITLIPWPDGARSSD